MKKIDTQNWGEFKIGDFFNAERGSVKKMQTLTEGDVPVIAAARKNQGVAGYYQVDAAYENRITVSCNGVGCGSTFYHDYPFNINGDAIVLIEKQEISAYAKRFVCCMLDGILTRKYSYAEKCSPEKALGEIIRLPVDELGIPDWSYMEQYMHSIQDSVKHTINAYNVLLGGGKSLNINKLWWNRFVIGDLFKNIVKPAVYHTREIHEDSSGIPYVVRSKFDNGVKCRVTPDGLQTSPGGVISFGAENATFFYQDEPWCSGRDIYYIDTQHLSKYSCLFVAACLKPIADKYSYSFGLFPDLLRKEVIYLPTTESGTPDWDYMDQYMRQMEKKAKQLLEKAA